MKKQTRERVVPTISANVSWLSLGTEVSGAPSLLAEATQPGYWPLVEIFLAPPLRTHGTPSTRMSA